MENLFSIGEIAKLAGVSVQTLRHYDKLGLIVPSQVTEAGYRLYSQADGARLELLRTLRGLGFDLASIGQLLDGAMLPAQAVQLQLEALELQQQTLKRQQVVLKAVMQGESEVILSRLSRMQALAGLDKLQRESFLSNHLKKAMNGQTGNPQVWKAAVLDLPEEMNEGQLELWLELAEIAASKAFQQVLKQQMEPVVGLSVEQSQVWSQHTQGLIAQAVRAVRENLSPGSKESQEILEGWIAGFARLQNRKPNKTYKRWLLEYFQSIHHPSMDRYWELVAKLKGWEYTPIYAQAFAWLLEGLRVEQGGRGEGVTTER